MILAIIGTMITVWFGEALLADLDGISSQIFAVQFQQIKRTMHGWDKRPMRANKLEHGEPFSSQTMASPSITYLWPGSASIRKGDERKPVAKVVSVSRNRAARPRRCPASPGLWKKLLCSIPVYPICRSRWPFGRAGQTRFNNADRAAATQRQI